MGNKRVFIWAWVLCAAWMLGGPSSPSFGQPPGQDVIPDHYIVVLHGDVPDPRSKANEMARVHGLSIGHVYSHAIRGFSAFIPAALLETVKADPNVAYVEPDQRVYAFAQTVPTGIQRIFADENTNITIDGNDDYRIDVDAAVIDTGIDYDHPDLNVVARTNCASGSPFTMSCADDDGDDGHGHGTHVAGTIGAIDNDTGVVGVAPGARLWAVRVLKNNGSGWNSWVIAGVDWVTAHASDIEVANMSLGGGNSQALCDAIGNSVSAGVVYAVAAGNDNADAANYSPANCWDVITVSALADFDGDPGGLGSPTCRSDQDDTLADFSNWGATIEITAPGVCILSTWKDGGYNTISGTSMASPHAAGVAALLASGTNKPSNQTEVFAIRDTLIAEGNSNWTDDSGDGTQEPLLDVSNMTVFAPATVAGSGSSTPDTTAPVISSAGASNITASSADISWTTDEPSDSVVRYGTTTPLGLSASDTSMVTSHLVGLSGLSAETTYFYEVESTDSSGNTAVDNNGGSYYSFTTGSASSSGFNLTATAYKVKGLQKADLAWSGATSADVDIWRDGAWIATTANDGAYTDNIDQRGGGSYTYRVCEAGTSTCSNEATVSF